MLPAAVNRPLHVELSCRPLLPIATDLFIRGGVTPDEGDVHQEHHRVQQRSTQVEGWTHCQCENSFWLLLLPAATNKPLQKIEYRRGSVGRRSNVVAQRAGHTANAKIPSGCCCCRESPTSPNRKLSIDGDRFLVDLCCQPQQTSSCGAFL